MQLPRGLARFNRVATNRVQRIWAPYLPPWILLTHRGRRSGTAYQTPLIASVRGGRIVIAVLYGPESDWVRNLTAAGSATLVRRGGQHQIDEIELVRSADRDDLGWPARVANHVVTARLT